MGHVAHGSHMSHMRVSHVTQVSIHMGVVCDMTHFDVFHTCNVRSSWAWRHGSERLTSARLSRRQQQHAHALSFWWCLPRALQSNCDMSTSIGCVYLGLCRRIVICQYHLAVFTSGSAVELWHVNIIWLCWRWALQTNSDTSASFRSCWHPWALLTLGFAVEVWHALCRSVTCLMCRALHICLMSHFDQRPARLF